MARRTVGRSAVYKVLYGIGMAMVVVGLLMDDGMARRVVAALGAVLVFGSLGFELVTFAGQSAKARRKRDPEQ
jgi:uncharacterized membrane protein YkgB